MAPLDKPHPSNSPTDRTARRRFIGAGTAAAPLLMTVASDPALGVTCFSPSRHLSKNTSVSQQGKYGDCTGVSPGNYKTQTNPSSPATNWPSVPAPTTLFTAVFVSGSRFNATVTKTAAAGGGTRVLTLFEVLNLPNVPSGVVAVPSDPGRLAFHTIGAYLNKQNGWIPDAVLTSTAIKNIWSEWMTKGYFEPTAGVQWYEADIVNYFKNSGIAP